MWVEQRVFDNFSIEIIEGKVNSQGRKVVGEKERQLAMEQTVWVVKRENTTHWNRGTEREDFELEGIGGVVVGMAKSRSTTVCSPGRVC